MKKVNIFIICFLYAALLQPALAQKLKYSRDIYPLIQEGNYLQAYRMLHLYLKRDPEAINAYYQLARISELRANRFDPLLQGHIVLRYADSCVHYYSEFNNRVNERELRRNAEFYEDLYTEEEKLAGKAKLDLNEIKSSTEQKINHYKTLRKNLGLILKHFQGAVRNYDFCISTYNQLTENYNTRNELLLLADQQLLQLLERMATAFDSTRYHLDQYRKAIDAYPLEKYNQRYEVRPINDFRIEASEPFVNFLKNNIILWDYASWARQLIHEIKNDVIPLKKQMTELMAGAQQAAKERNYYEPDRFTLLRINRYDGQSLAQQIIMYLSNKSSYLYERTLHTNISTNPREEIRSLSNQLYYVSQAHESIQKTAAQSNERNFKKYHDIFASYYNNSGTLKQYCQQEGSWARAEISNIEGELKDRLARLSESLPTVSYENRPLYVRANSRPISEVAEGEWITLESKSDGLGSYYLCGYQRQSNDQLIAFVAKISDGKVAWLQKLTEQGASTVCPSIDLTEDGCIVVQANLSTGSYILQSASVQRFNAAGKPAGSWQLSLGAVPRFIRYDTNVGSWAACLKGNTFIETGIAQDKVFVLEAKASDGQIQWQKEFQLTGSVIDLIPVEGAYLIVGNFREISFPDGEAQSSRSGGNPQYTNIFAVRYSSKRGNLTHRNYYYAQQPVSIYQAYKATDRAIHLLGRNAPWSLQAFRFEPMQSLHLVIDQYANFYYPIRSLEK